MLLRRGESCRSRAQHGHAFTALNAGPLRPHPVFGPRPVDDRNLHLLDRHRVGVDPQHATGLAGCGTESPGEFRKVVGSVQAVNRVPPATAVDQVVPVRDHVPQGATLVAKGDPAVHAAATLTPQLLLGHRLVHLVPVEDAQLGGSAGRRDPGEFDEAARLTHDRCLAGSAGSSSDVRCICRL